MGNAFANVTRQSYDLGGGVRGGIEPSGFTWELTGAGASDRQSPQSATGSINGEGAFNDAFDTVYSNADSYSNGFALEVNSIIGEQGFGGVGGIVELDNMPGGRRLVKGDEIWVRVRLKFPLGFTFNVNGLNKFLRLRTGHDDGAGGITSHGYDDLYLDGDGSGTPMLRFIYEGAQEWYNASTLAPIALDEWHTFELYLKLDNIKGTAGGDSMVRIWKEGLLVGETNDRNTLVDADDFIYDFYFFTYWDNAGADRTQNWLADDLVVTNQPTATDAAGNAYIGMT